MEESTNSTSAEYFAYRPLQNTNAFRLLILHSGSQGQPIRCSLENDSALDPAPYEALSYVWGDAFVREPIFLKNKLLYVTTNLFSALEHLRYPHRDRVLWADAVCIDQKNNSERSQQVLLMAKIFSNAYRVLVWLGRESGDSVLAMDIAQRVSKFVDDGRQGPGSTGPDEQRPLDLTESELTALENLFAQRDWWKRLWVVQEIALAKRVRLICGPRTLNWDVLRALRIGVQVPRLRDSALSPRFGEIFSAAWELDISRTTKETGRGFSQPRLCSLMQTFSRKKYADPRDLCYGLLAMAPLQKASLKPEYEKSLEQVFIHITRLMIQDSGFLDVICMTRRGLSGRSTKLPSWVPDWRIPASHPDHYDKWKVTRSDDHNPPRTAKVADISLAAPNEHEEHILRVKGNFLDRVACFADDRNHSTGGWIELVKPWIADENLTSIEVDSEAKSKELAEAYTTLVELLQNEWDHLEASARDGDLLNYTEALYRRKKLAATSLRWLRDCPCAISLMDYQDIHMRDITDVAKLKYWQPYIPYIVAKFTALIQHFGHGNSAQLPGAFGLWCLSMRTSETTLPL